MTSTEHADSQGPLWEVFVQPKNGDAHEHVGSVHAPDAEMALQNARDVYTRRGAVRSIWVVRASEIVASCPEDAPAFFDPSDDKAYRHPSFYRAERRSEDFE